MEAEVDEQQISDAASSTAVLVATSVSAAPLMSEVFKYMPDLANLPDDEEHRKTKERWLTIKQMGCKLVTESDNVMDWVSRFLAKFSALQANLTTQHTEALALREAASKAYVCNLTDESEKSVFQGHVVFCGMKHAELRKLHDQLVKVCTEVTELCNRSSISGEGLPSDLAALLDPAKAQQCVLDLIGPGSEAVLTRYAVLEELTKAITVLREEMAEIARAYYEGIVSELHFAKSNVSVLGVELGSLQLCDADLQQKEHQIEGQIQVLMAQSDEVRQSLQSRYDEESRKISERLMAQTADLQNMIKASYTQREQFSLAHQKNMDDFTEKLKKIT